MNRYEYKAGGTQVGLPYHTGFGSVLKGREGRAEQR